MGSNEANGGDGRSSASRRNRVRNQVVLGYILDHAQAEAARELVQLGLISEVGACSFLLSSKASNLLVSGKELMDVSAMKDFVRSHVPDEEKSLFELMADLRKQGWRQRKHFQEKDVSFSF